MRDYGKVSPVFWTGTTGRAIKARGSEAVIVAVYLMTSPHSNMLGLYYQPMLYMAHETGLGVEGASKGLQGCVEAGFCAYDPDSEMVWVYEMASYQIAKELKASDNRCGGIQREYEGLQKNRFLSDFFDRYCTAFHLTARRDSTGAKQAPSKPLPSQEQEQEQEQKQDLAPQPSLLPSDPPAPPAAPRPPSPPSASAAAPRGTRLPADWKLTKSLAEEARRVRSDAGLAPLTDVELRAEGAKFRDHWHAAAGAKGVKLDWPATWRNWIRNARPAMPFAGAPPVAASAQMAATADDEDAT